MTWQEGRIAVSYRTSSFSISLDAARSEPPQHVRTQGCPRLREALLERLAAPDGLLRDHVPGSGFRIEQHPSRTASTTELNVLAPVPRSRAIRAISLTAASVNVRSAPWNLLSFRYCAISDPDASSDTNPVSKSLCHQGNQPKGPQKINRYT